MRLITSSIILITIIMALAVPGHATVYLNRRLIECDPFTYVVEPLEMIGTGLYLDRDFQNPYGECIDAPPGPPFIIEMPVIIENEYNTDGTVSSWGSLTIDNRYGSGDPFVIEIRDYASLLLNGYVTAQGKAGDPIIFANDGHLYSNWTGPHGDEEGYNLEFEWCEFNAGQFCTEPTLDLRSGHLIMNNCSFGPTIDTRGLYHDSYYHHVWSVILNDCVFSGISYPVGSPNLIVASTIDINNVQFYDCTFPGNLDGVLAIAGVVVSVDNLKNLNGIGGSGNSRNWVKFTTSVNVKDSCTIRCSNDFTVFMSNWLKIDTNAVCVMEKGTVLQMRDDAQIDVYGRMILDSTALTSYADGAYGINIPGVSRENQYQSYSWYGIDVDAVGSLEMRNGSVLRWAESPIEGTGDVLVDHSTIEQCWGKSIDIYATRPTKLEVRSSIITDGGIRFFLERDSAAGRVIIDSNQITRAGEDGVYLGGGQGWSFDDSLNVLISNNVISGNAGSGIYGYLFEPTDSIVILNNQLIGNDGSGLYLSDGNCDSLKARVENNVALGNLNIGFGVRGGIADFIGNTSAYNGGAGISYPYKPKRLGHVANNIIAYNAYSNSYGFSCDAKYGGTVPELAHNVFWQNGDASGELYINADEFTIYTVAELQALGGVAVTNEEFTPTFPPVYRDVIRSFQYDSSHTWTALWVDGDNLEPGQLKGMAIIPSHRDTSARYYVLGNSSDTIYVSRDLTEVVNNFDTLTVFDYHLTSFSPAIDFGTNDYVTTEVDIDGDERILDSDKDGSKLVDAGADEFNPDTVTNFIYVTLPIADTTLVPGNAYNIVWTAGEIENVKIEYALDIKDGQEAIWQEIAASVPAMPGIYAWTVPQALSYRTKIRISDLGSSGIQAESDFFHVKPYCLTRVAADSSYEQFAPSSDGWSFGNVASSLWPESWWQQYDYLTGIDPYTGREYPSGASSYPFALMPSSAYPSWPHFVEAFGVDQCYFTTGTGLAYVTRALNRWGDIAHPWGGSCFGMSNGSGLAFSHRDGLTTRWGDLGLPNNLYQVSISDDLRALINVTYLAQFGKVHTDYVQAHRWTTPKEAVEQLRAIFMDKTNATDASLFLANRTYTQAHSVYPYELVNDPNPWLVKLFIYDPNYSGDDLKYITIDTVNNLWEYTELFDWAGNWYMFPNEPINNCLGTPELTCSSPSYPVLAKQSAEGPGEIEIIFPSDGYITAHNDAGDSIGYGAEGGFVTIESAILLPTMHATDGHPYRMIVPDEPYQVALFRMKESSVRIGFYLDSLYIGYSREGVDSTAVENLSLSDGLTIDNPDIDSKQINMRVARTLSDGERALAIDSLNLLQSESIRLEVLDTSGWYLDNLGSALTYKLWMRQVKTSTGEWQFSTRDIALPSGVAHILTPSWSALSNDSCTIYLDYNHDYVADDSLTLYNDIVLGVNDDPLNVLPYRFEMGQNYPNPFNPVTTIEYSLPRRCHVTIDIFNALGQKVRTLVDRVESAGSYSISWNGTTADGQSVATGVYLYRFKAGDHLETKKMLLLK